MTDAHSNPALEKSTLTLGYMPLIDSAALAVAKEHGLFADHGLDVTLQAEPSWANIRDKVAMGLLDGAQMLAGMPIAASVGAGPVQVPMVTAFSMSLNGNAITVSDALYDRLLELEPGLGQDRCLAGSALKSLIEADKKAGRPPLVFAHVYNFSSHNYQLRYWLAAAGIDPDNDVRLVVVPPPQMQHYMSIGNVDGYCAGEPWNSQAVEQGAGRVLITGYEIWNNAPEKVFGVTRQWADENPQTHKALIQALIQASIWLDQPENREQAAQLLSDNDYLPLPVESILTSMNGRLLQQTDTPSSVQHGSVFHHYCANYPWVSHAQWFISQMYRWGQLTRAVDIAAQARQVYLPALYREAAAELGLTAPVVSTRLEGMHASMWQLSSAEPLMLGPDRFVDGRVFDPAHCLDYLRESLVHHESLTADLLHSLVTANS